MSTGFILVQVYIAEQASPITTATIQIKNASTGKVVTTEKVDKNGRTKKISVATPKKEYSLQKSSTDVPYASYDINVSAPGYNTVTIKGVQVFPNVTSLQKIQMTVAFKGKSIGKVVTIPKHALTRKNVTQQQEGPPEDGVPFILQSPVIPEYITVHLGSPSSSARDVTVRFNEYIKNVASSEIYPTWPENAIRANVYAQISFALNRVFTEWYRNKGYPFQITSSTAYDQSFVDGRNIFDNISEIVDGIFNQYITKSDQKIPFFAQYCNGTTVTCKGLSQWGTVDLAEENYLPYQILQYYYGDVGIIKGAMVEGIPDSYPGTIIKEGASGDAVYIIQNQLNRIRKNYPAIQIINPVDGVFGKSTKEAVKEFQKIFNLTQSGFVDSATWYKISAIYVSVTKLAELDGSGVGEDVPLDDDGTDDGNIGGPDLNGDTDNTLVPYPGYLIKQGARGDIVRTLQRNLNRAAGTYTSIPKVQTDGIFGSATKQAVIAFQQQVGIAADGIVGPTTWAKLNEVLINSNRPGAGEGEPYPGYLIKYGSSGEMVKKVQRNLNKIATKYTIIKKLKVDGIFGSTTKRSVIAFQNQFGLAADGIVGPITWDKINEVVGIIKKKKRFWLF